MTDKQELKCPECGGFMNIQYEIQCGWCYQCKKRDKCGYISPWKPSQDLLDNHIRIQQLKDEIAEQAAVYATRPSYDPATWTEEQDSAHDMMRYKVRQLKELKDA